MNNEKEEKTYTICNSVFEDRSFNNQLYKPFLKKPNYSCNIKLRFLINKSHYYDLDFINDMPNEKYNNTRFYLIAMTTIGITEEDNIAVMTNGNNYKIVSLPLIYWKNVIYKSLNMKNNDCEFVININPIFIKLHEIHAYSGNICIERFEA